MHARIVFAIVGLIFSAASGAADPRVGCISACQTAMRACTGPVNAGADLCKAKVRDDCNAKPIQEKVSCFKAAFSACPRGEGIDACSATFRVCHANCKPAPKGQNEYWCAAEADRGDGKFRKDGYCWGAVGKPYDEQLAACLKQFQPKAGEVGDGEYLGGSSVECTPL